MTVPPSPMRHRQPSDDGMTRVELTWIEKRIEHWIRFGRVAVDEIVDRRRRIVRFRPGAIFAFVRGDAAEPDPVLDPLLDPRQFNAGHAVVGRLAVTHG